MLTLNPTECQTVSNADRKKKSRQRYRTSARQELEARANLPANERSYQDGPGYGSVEAESTYRRQFVTTATYAAQRLLTDTISLPDEMAAAYRRRSEAREAQDLGVHFERFKPDHVIIAARHRAECHALADLLWMQKAVDDWSHVLPGWLVGLTSWSATTDPLTGPPRPQIGVEQ